jgi:hypothetical protein
VAKPVIEVVGRSHGLGEARERGHDRGVVEPRLARLGIMRACFETQKLEQLESRMDEIADRVPYARTSTHEAQRYSN